MSTIRQKEAQVRFANLEKAWPFTSDAKLVINTFIEFYTEGYTAHDPTQLLSVLSTPECEAFRFVEIRAMRNGIQMDALCSQLHHRCQTGPSFSMTQANPLSALVETRRDANGPPITSLDILYDLMYLFRERTFSSRLITSRFFDSNGISAYEMYKDLEKELAVTGMADKFPNKQEDEMTANYIFVSYSRKDAEMVDEVVESLKWLGYTFWIDRKSLKFGHWPTKISDALTSCRAVIVFISDHSVNSDAVYDEVHEALQKSKPVVPVALSDPRYLSRLEKLIGDRQFIKLDKDREVTANIIQNALEEADIEPILYDPTDPELDEVMRLLDDGQYSIALEYLEEIVGHQPAHLAVVALTVIAYYNAGQARVLQEERQGIRPLHLNEMVSEFRRAEEIATKYIPLHFGHYDRFLKGQLWATLGMIASFVGKYDDAFKRLTTALECYPERKKIKQSLEKLRTELRLQDRRGRFRVAFPEPQDYAAHPIAFPFTIEIGPSGKIVFPDYASENWKSLYIIDHNIGQLERVDDGTNTLTILLEACDYLSSFTDSFFAELAAKRIVFSIVGRESVSGLLPPGKSKSKSEVYEAFRNALKENLDLEDKKYICDIWNSIIDYPDYIVDCGKL